MKKYFAIFLGIFLILGIYSPIFAMNDGTYQISPDVLNQTGDYTSGDGYRLWHNLGESVTGTATGSGYIIHEGFLQPDVQELSISFSASSIDFGTLSLLAANEQDINITIINSIAKGYALQAYDNTPAGIAYGLIDGTNTIADATTPGVYINLPGAGIEHYGITVIGTNADPGYSSGTKINSMDNISPINIGSYNGYTSGDIFNIKFIAGIADDTEPAQNYQALTTFILTANY